MAQSILFGMYWPLVYLHVKLTLGLILVMPLMYSLYHLLYELSFAYYSLPLYPEFIFLWIWRPKTNVYLKSVGWSVRALHPKKGWSIKYVPKNSSFLDPPSLWILTADKENTELYNRPMFWFGPSLHPFVLTYFIDGP